MSSAQLKPESLLAAVVIARNEERSIAACLAAAQEGLDTIGGGDLLMVDSASTDRTAQIALEMGFRVYFIHRASVLSPSAARRIGESLTRSRYVLFLDGDCVLEPGFLPEALRMMEVDSRLGVLTGSRRDFYRTRSGIVPAHGEYYLTQRHAVRGVVHYGGCALYRRAALRAAGSFNPFLQAMEEADVGQRIITAGYQISALPTPMIRHTTVQRESLLRLQRSFRHGFFTGRGQALRLFLLRGRIRSAFQGLSRVVATLFHLGLGLACLMAWLLLGVVWPAVAWMAASALLFVMFVVRGRSLHRAVYYVMEWIAQGAGLLYGVVRPMKPVGAFRWDGEERLGVRADAPALPKVLLVGPRPGSPVHGGVARGIELLARTDLARRSSMRVFNSYRQRDPKRRFGARVLDQLGMMRALWREIRACRPDVVHVKTSCGANFHQNALYSLVARIAGLPVILQIHDGKFASFIEDSPPIMRSWIRYALHSVPRVLVLCRDGEAHLRSVAPRARVSIVPNGLDEREAADLEPAEGSRRPQVFFMGTGDAQLDLEKGLDVLLQVLPELAVRFPGSRWVLAGLADPKQVAVLLNAGAGTEGDERIRCLGKVAGEEKAELLKSSTILVLPSYFENMPNILLEAMAAGMGVVATRVGAIPEIVGRSQGGVVIDTGRPEALREALEELLRDPAGVRERGRRNRATVLQHFTMSAVERALEAAYCETAGWLAPTRFSSEQPAENGAANARSLSIAGGVNPA